MDWDPKLQSCYRAKEGKQRVRHGEVNSLHLRRAGGRGSRAESPIHSVLIILISLFLMAHLLAATRICSAQGIDTSDFQPYSGTIDHKHKIRVQLKIDEQNRVRGSYCYQKYGENLALSGYLSENLRLKLLESAKGKITGMFVGRFVGQNTIQGLWTDASGKKSYEFILNREIDSNKEVRLEFIGDTLHLSYKLLAVEIPFCMHHSDDYSAVLHYSAWSENIFIAVISYNYCSRSCGRGRGPCAGGEETEISWLRFDDKLHLIERKTELIRSCLYGIEMYDDGIRHTAKEIALDYTIFKYGEKTTKRMTLFKNRLEQGFHIAVGEDTQAVVACTEQIHSHAHDEKAYFNRARALQNLYRYYDAIRDYNKVIELYTTQTTQPDPKKPTGEYEGARERYVKSFYFLGRIYEFLSSNENRQQYQAKAFEMFSKASEFEDTESQYSLGVMHYSGSFVEKNYKKATEWFLKAATHGHIHAQRMLGGMYLIGEGVNKDSREAFHWYLAAAELGDSSAVYPLADMYDRGTGVVQDSFEAYKWFYLAAPSSESLGRMERLAGKLTEENLQRAEELARLWIMNNTGN